MGATSAGAAAPVRPKRVVITHKAGSVWWEKPSILWQGIGTTRERRLERLISSRILPLVQHLEATYLCSKGAKPLLHGRSLMEIERNPKALVRAVSLFDKAYAKGLVAFRGKGQKTGKSSPHETVGSCGMSVNEARTLYIRRSAHKYLGRHHDVMAILGGSLGNLDYTDPTILKRLRVIAKFDKRSLELLNNGLQGRLDRLLRKDEKFLEALNKSGFEYGVRPLHDALEDHFIEFLNWPASMLEAVFEHLDHPAKIEAMGPTLLMVEDQRVLEALGKWPLKEMGSGGEMKSHIAIVRKKLGGDFLKLINSTPAGIEQAGVCSLDQLDELKRYLDYVDEKVMYILARLPFNQQMGVLGGLWSKLGTGFMESYLASKRGYEVLVKIIKSIKEMEARGSAPGNVRALIEGDFFNEDLKAYLPR